MDEVGHPRPVVGDPEPGAAAAAGDDASGVQQAVVFGRESVMRNQEVAACVVGAPQVNEIDLLQFCRMALSAWQVPNSDAE